MKNIKNLIISLLVVLLIVPFVSSLPEVNAGDIKTVTIYASKIKNETSAYYKYYPDKNSVTFMYTEYNIDFVIDEDVEFYRINYSNNLSYNVELTLTIKGNKKLTVTDAFYCPHNYVQESGTDVYVISNGLHASKSVNIKSGANFSAYEDESKNKTTLLGIIASGKINISGNVYIDSDNTGINAQGGINISGGKVHCTSQGTTIYSWNEINISGGEVILKSSNSQTLSGYDINISGGNIEATSDQIGDEDENDKPNIKAYTSINISEPMYIKEPEEGYVKERENSDKIIVDKNGLYPHKIIIADKAAEEAAKKAAEEAEKKAAEEAEKKAAEEAAKKKAEESKYSNEWVNGKWYNAEGVSDYSGTLEWKSNSTGWWVEDSAGWYPVSQWQKIDGKWYYFQESGYMDYSGYRDGYWLGSDGALVDGYFGQWKCNSKGWWFEDTSGWYPSSAWVKIDGSWYYFEADGYMAISKYIDGYWIGADGVCQ